MIQSHRDLSKYFPRLNIDKLKTIAQRWVDNNSSVPINRIVLYNYASKRQKTYEEEIKKKYAVVFEILKEYKRYGMNPQELQHYHDAIDREEIITPDPIDEFHDRDEKAPDPIDKFLDDTEYFETIKPENPFLSFMTADFEDVYWETPKFKFKKEWDLMPRTLIYDAEKNKRMLTALPDNVRTKEYETLFQVQTKIIKHGLELLRDITVCHDKDKDKIRIRMPKKKFKQYDYGQDLKFSVVKNKRKELDTFIKIISQPPFIFYTGKKKKELHFYDANQKLLSRINQKLLIFFNSKLKLNLPKTFKLYEKCVDEKLGTYRFIFKIIEQTNKDPIKNKLEKLEKDSLIKKFKEFCSQARLEPNDTKHYDKITAATQVLLEKNWMSKNDIEEEVKGHSSM